MTAAFGMGVLLICRESLASERIAYEPTKTIDTVGLRHKEVPLTGNLWDYMRERLSFSCGAAETYNDNLQLQDNNKSHEWVSSVNTGIKFDQLHGSLIYGVDWKVDAFRYHRRNKNAIDHHAHTFIDYDSQGRLKWDIQYDAIR